MQLIYKTNDIKRADELQNHLEQAGIAAAVHGAGTYSLVRNKAADAVSVWVVKDEDLPKAQALLGKLFQSEAAASGSHFPPKPVNKRLRSALLVFAAFVTCLLAMLAAFSF